ncbi:hypothetical protein POSPLADRAFT_1043607 [Postia placenta MAD-698-R-SB12]|uniref:Hyaluronan-mediated motility receptor C-terminal domain-containing protein n=1 Tax=Postia placenta MAD-698-R-SB12 TaxID=670580 RepID=A0A1X6NCK7_9APHY|nr:hypothetical protein POSPLADRAFT_1043607 [Postia placenta MAD-698-R-SB12]OSX66113.1 hypothetical protein POSPLADRAFT_1043607 [Postia placenta MAD-698-R-SB12]
MFPRGPRFPAPKAPDVPGPNAYNPQDPEYDAYKRGAFLEKTNRFTKDNPSDVPGPGTYNTETNATRSKPPNNGTKSNVDRFAVLQRKLEELERVHTDGKKSHHLELERLKLDLSRAQRAATEHAERADKLKKQNEQLEARLQELKKSTVSEQGDLRDLRIKLKAAEHERTQLAAKQGETSEMKKALQAAEAKRKDDLRERDRRIAELERGLQSEKKKREMAEARLADVKGKVDMESQQARAAVSDLESQLASTRADVYDTKASLEDLKAQAADTEEELLERLEQHRALLARVANEYGRLAAATVHKSHHIRVQDQSNNLQLRVFRLERKLANADGQVVELANLVRHTKEENIFLAARLREADEEAVFYARLASELSNPLPDPPAWRELDRCLDNIADGLQRSRAEIHERITADFSTWVDLHRLRDDALVFHSSVLLKALDQTNALAQRHSTQLTDAQARCTELQTTLATAQEDCANAQEQLVETKVALEKCQALEAALRKDLDNTRAQMQQEASKGEQLLQKEKDANTRLADTVHKSRMAEEGLQAEIEQLTSDLAQAEQYQEAYNGLLEEVDALVAKNALAEEEAVRLSKFNAEIVGHRNPAQRIVYVDKIRRELHETKQKLLMTSRDRDAVQAHNEDLQYEIALYKSVAIPSEYKPRTAVTRVERAPMVTQGLSISKGVEHGKSISVPSARLASMPEMEYEQGGMTLDEIM